MARAGAARKLNRDEVKRYDSRPSPVCNKYTIYATHKRADLPVTFFVFGKYNETL